MTLTFAYWNCRGRGSAPRLMLRYAKADYNDVVYSLDGPPYNFDKYFGEKESLGLDFANLPYLKDDENGVKITESMAILRYLGRKFGLCATSDPELATEDMLMMKLNDCVERMVIANYHKQPYATEADFEKEMEQLRKEHDSTLELFEKFLVPGKWLTGDKLSYVDFLAYEIFDWYRELVPNDSLKKHEKLSAYMKRFEELENLKDFLASDEYRKNAIFGPFAKFGNKKKE